MRATPTSTVKNSILTCAAIRKQIASKELELKTLVDNYNRDAAAFEKHKANTQNQANHLQGAIGALKALLPHERRRSTPR